MIVIHLWSAFRVVAGIAIFMSMLLVLPIAFVNPLAISRFVPIAIRARVVRRPSH